MKALDLQSEAFPPTGGAAAEGVQNQLGRPKADRLSVLVRESIQNSWDARLPEQLPVRYQIDGYELSDRSRKALAEYVFAHSPTGMSVTTRLSSALAFPVLAISDFSTTGLGGPTRGDQVPEEGESTNFVDFLRYIGKPANRDHAGGTFGFGKAAYYLASRLRTVCVYTRFRKGTHVHSRFMATGLGPQFETKGREARRFTGRHWWGRKAADGIVDPVVEGEADSIATLLGDVGRRPDSTGTTVFILEPDLEGAGLAEALHAMGETVLAYFWPKLLDGANGEPSMEFSVRLNGVERRLPSIAKRPAFVLLGSAFRAALMPDKVSSEVQVEEIISLRPKKKLGNVAIARKLAGAPSGIKSEPSPVDEASALSFLQGGIHHIAVMRAPHFVVKYIEGPAVPYEQIEYAGVFLVDPAVDTAFARSEPPTHDDWAPDLLSDQSEKTFVRVAQRRLRDVVETYLAPTTHEGADAHLHSLGNFALRLGALIPGVLPPRSSRPSRTTPFGTGAGAAKGRAGKEPAERFEVLVEGEPSLELIDGLAAMVVTFRVEGRPGSRVRVHAIPRVLTADGFESEPPRGEDRPRIVAWAVGEGKRVAERADTCDLTPGDTFYKVAVTVPPDTMISLSLTSSKL
jgi:hypothetical protein